MSEKRTCCYFFRNLFKKQAKSSSFSSKGQFGSDIKTNIEDNSEIIIHKKTITTEAKVLEKPSFESSISVGESGSNSLFYDKNSGLIQEIDKNMALENLNEAYEIIHFPHEKDVALSQRKSKTDRDRFSKVVKDINFKEILAGEESISLSERSDPSELYSRPPN